jgi:hypothetical protein
LYDIHEKNKKRVQAIIEALEDGGDTILKMKQAFIEMFARFEIDQEFRQVEEVFLKIEFAAIIREDADLREKFHKSRSEMQENLLKIIRNGQKSGSIRLDINPENIALAITSFYIGLSTLWFTKIVEFSIKEKAKDYIDILFNGILNNN